MPAPAIELDVVYHVDQRDFHGPAEDTQRFQAAAHWIARRLRIDRLFVSIAIVDDATIQVVNAERLGHDWPTDVISFEIDRQAGYVEGEVIASLETAARISPQANWPVADELLLYVVHGMLHVMGLDDGTPRESQAMRTLERECLLALGLAEAVGYQRRFSGIFNSELSE